MTNQHRELNLYRKKFARKIIFGSLDEHRLAKLKVAGDSGYACLSPAYNKRHALRIIQTMSKIITILLAIILGMFLYFYIRIPDALVQIGALAATMAILIMLFGVTCKVCEGTIRDEDLIIQTSKVTYHR